VARSDASSKPWDGMHWSDEGTQEWRDGLSDAEVDEWHDWQLKGEREESERWTRELAAGIAQIERAESDPQSSAEPQAPSGPESSGPTVSFVDGAGNPLDAIVNDEPVRIQATVPREPGVDPPATLEVAISGTRTSFIGREYGGTDTVTLRWTGNQGGPAIYTSDVLTIEDGGGGAGSVGFGFDIATGAGAGSVGGFDFEFATGSTGGFVTDDGDVIQIGLDGARSAVQVYTSVTRLELALTMTAIGTANQMYVNILINLRGLEAELAGAPDSPEKTALLDKVSDLRAGAEAGVALTQRAVAYVNSDVLDHQKLAVARLYGEWLGLFREPTEGTDAVGSDVAVAELRWHDPREESRLVLVAQEQAKEEVRRIIWHGLAQATIAGYRLLAQSTMVAQIMTLAGTTEMGESATGMDKWMAFWDIVTQGALMGASIKWNHSTITARPTARIPRTQPIRDTQTAAGAPTGTVVAPEAAGMLRAAGLDAQLIARKHDVAIQVRFTNPDAMIPRATGAAPKPMALKSKTLKPIDREIGAPANAQDGAVGLFEPKLPARGTRTDAEWAAVQERYNLRKGEWEGAIGNHQRKLVDKGEFQVRDGMMCDKDGTPIAGDYDLFEITYRDGTPVPQSVYDAVVADLMVAPHFQAAHGAHMRWNPLPYDEPYHLNMSGDLDTAMAAVAKWKADRSIFEGIVGQHQPGREGLITFTPSQPPVITYAGEAVGPKLAELGVTVPPSIAAWQNPFPRPTLYLATADQLVAGRFPEGEGWEWTQHFDWNAELDGWAAQYDEITGSAPMLRISGRVTYPGLDAAAPASVGTESTAVAPASFIPWWLRISPAIWAAGLGLVAVLAIGGYLVMGGGAPGVPIVATSPTATIAATATVGTAVTSPSPSPSAPATASPSPTLAPTPTPIALITGDSLAFGEFVRTSGACPVAERYNALYEFTALDGDLTMNQLPINHTTDGTLTRTGPSEAIFRTTAIDQTYEGMINGNTVLGTNHYTDGDCDVFYDFLLTLQRPFVAPPPAGTAPGFFELLDGTTFEQQLQLVGGPAPHLVVASFDDPDITMLLPIRVILYVGDEMPWNTLIEGDPNAVCRGTTGCSIDAPGAVDPAWLALGQHPLLVAFAADGTLIAVHAQNGLPPDGLPPPYTLPQ